MRVSTTTGMTATWSRDGKTIYYVTSDGKVMAAVVTVAGGAIRVGAVRELFSIDGQYAGTRSLTFDHTRQRFIFVKRLEEDAGLNRLPIVLTNWTAHAPVSLPPGR